MSKRKRDEFEPGSEPQAAVSAREVLEETRSVTFARSVTEREFVASEDVIRYPDGTERSSRFVKSTETVRREELTVVERRRREREVLCKNIGKLSARVRKLEVQCRKPFNFAHKWKCFDSKVGSGRVAEVELVSAREEIQSKAEIASDQRLKAEKKLAKARKALRKLKQKSRSVPDRADDGEWSSLIEGDKFAALDFMQKTLLRGECMPAVQLCPRFSASCQRLTLNWNGRSVSYPATREEIKRYYDDRTIEYIRGLDSDSESTSSRSSSSEREPADASNCNA